jgi:hypothetical protein
MESLPLLYYVRLDGNRFEGNLPELGNFPLLTRFDAGENFLSGSIPPSVGNCTNLTEFKVQYNNLSGDIPQEMQNLVNMVDLDLSYNQLSGTLDFVCPLNKVKYLRLSFNIFSGAIPDCFSTHTDMEILTLQSTGISGIIPESLADATQLEILNLGGNNLEDGIPESFTRLTNLIALDLSYNLLDASLVDVLSILRALPNLSTLNLKNNKISGGLPINSLVTFEAKYFQKLVSLNLGSNNLTGPLVRQLGMLSNLQEVDLSWNQFTGPIPDTYRGMSYLYVQGNDLSGAMPPFLIAVEPMISYGSYSCPALSSAYDRNAVISVNSSYYNYTYCACNFGYYGSPPNCLPCLEYAKCNGSKVTWVDGQVVEVEEAHLIITRGYAREYSLHNIRQLLSFFQLHQARKMCKH